MTLKTNALLIAVTASLLAPAAALAEKPLERSDRGQQRMERMDTNKDGAISLDEMTARTTERFGAADADGDGTITVEEMAAHLEKRAFERRARRMLERMDYDGDGKVTVAELQNRAQKRFALMDANDDGQVSAEEFRANRHFGKRHHHGKKRRGSAL